MGKEFDEAIAKARKLVSSCLEGPREGSHSYSTLETMLKAIAKEISPSFKGRLDVEDHAIIEQPGNRLVLSISFLPDGTIRKPCVCDDVVKRYLQEYANNYNVSVTLYDSTFEKDYGIFGCSFIYPRGD